MTLKIYLKPSSPLCFFPLPPPHRPPLMGSRTHSPRSPSFVLPSVLALVFLSFPFLFLQKVNDFATQTKTVVGHNLDPTPWHIFPPKQFEEESKHALAYKIFQCSYLSCGYNSFVSSQTQQVSSGSAGNAQNCSKFFKFIYRDLEPWAKTRITKKHLEEAQQFAAFRVVIVDGRLYTDLYYACVQSRVMFTLWGFLQLMKKYPGMVPDVDLMFDCMDKPNINRAEHADFPLPLFRYCTTADHFDIPFPDWSFWGWPEVNILPWDEQFRDIKNGSQRTKWHMRVPLAFWRGNPGVAAPIRTELLQCNDSMKWGAEILVQNWDKEAKAGFERSKLSKQCTHRYKIYAEGYAWSVSLKYILSCGSLALLISPQYEDFFSRGLLPAVNYWPVSSSNMCQSIKHAVDWGNTFPNMAQKMGRRGQKLMETLTMDRVYDYMLHLLAEYAKLQDFKPEPPSSAQEVCEGSLLCFADPTQRRLLERSSVEPSTKPPCNLDPVNPYVLWKWLAQKKRVVNYMQKREMRPPWR